MKRLLIPAALFAAAALAGHALTLHLVPRLIMDRAMERLSWAAGTNALLHAPPATPQSRNIVMPSPDLAYSVCVFDLADGAVRLRAARGEGYMSVSLYAANSDNSFTINDLGLPAEGLDALIVRPGAPRPEGAATVVESPGRRGIALVRRLSEDEESLRAIRAGDVCQPERRPYP